jgi:ADP-ribosylation factor related protein 1
VVNSPRLLNLPLLLLANSLSVAEVRESFDAWNRSRSTRAAEGHDEERGLNQDNGGANGNGGNGKGKGKARAEGENIQESRAGKDGDHSPEEAGWDDGGARDERLASLDVMGASALEG